MEKSDNFIDWFLKHQEEYPDIKIINNPTQKHKDLLIAQMESFVNELKEIRNQNLKKETFEEKIMEDRCLFRAKRIDNGELVQGYIVKYGYTGREKYYIVPDYASDLYAFLIDKSTIYQCTGMKDKNGRLIWENDIVDFPEHRGIIRYEGGCFGIAYKNLTDWENDWEKIQKNIKHKSDFMFISLYEIYWSFNDEDNCLNTVEVIGNIFDNPETI